MAAHQVAKRKVWVGLVLLLLGVGLVVVAPVGADTGASGNLTCADVVGDLGLTDVVSAKDTQRTAPFPAEGYWTFTDNGLTVSYRLVGAPEGAPDPYVLEFEAASAPIFGVFVKQAAEKQDVSRSGLFPAGTVAGSLYVPDGEFSHVSFCTGTLPTTEPTTTETSTTTTTQGSTTTTQGSTTTAGRTTTAAPTTTVGPTTTAAPTTTPPMTTEPTTTEAPTTEPSTTVDVDDDDVTTTTEATTTTTSGVRQPVAEVLHDVVVRDLPRTGTGTGALAGIGVAMLLLGAYLVGHNSHRSARLERSLRVALGSRGVFAAIFRAHVGSGP